MLYMCSSLCSFFRWRNMAIVFIACFFRYSHYKSGSTTGAQPINLIERAQNTVNSCCGRTWPPDNVFLVHQRLLCLRFSSSCHFAFSSQHPVTILLSYTCIDFLWFVLGSMYCLYSSVCVGSNMHYFRLMPVFPVIKLLRCPKPLVCFDCIRFRQWWLT